MIFVGDDWAEGHHDLALMDEKGKVIVSKRFSEGAAGVRQMHELIAEHADDASQVRVGIETDRGLWVASMIAAGYEVYAVNPLAVARYRERYSFSGAKSDTKDAELLADLVRTDAHKHRQVAGDTPEAEALQVLARAHQRLIWDRTRQVNRLRNVLREYFPAALEAFPDLAHSDAVAVLRRAATPAEAARLSVSAIEATLKRGGRERYAAHQAEKIQAVLRAERLNAKPVVAQAYGAQVRAMIAVIGELNRQIQSLEDELASSFEAHPDAEIILSFPGLGLVLGARVLGEFGDDPNRYADAKSRRNYAGTSPVTRQSGKSRIVRVRYVNNSFLVSACYLWAFASITKSPGARAYYDAQKAKGASHDGALRALANKFVGMLHGCLTHGCKYDEEIAWGEREVAEAA
jgi:transposase